VVLPILGAGGEEDAVVRVQVVAAGGYRAGGDGDALAGNHRLCGLGVFGNGAHVRSDQLGVCRSFSSLRASTHPFRRMRESAR
jgi:hypothetical protein